MLLAFHTRVLGIGMICLSARGSVLYHRFLRGMSMPNAARNDVNRPGTDSGLHFSFVGQESDLGLSLQHVDQFVPIRVTLPWRFPDVRANPQVPSIERLEDPERCLLPIGAVGTALH